MKISGGCHCGHVRFDAYVGDAVELLDCNCSICAMTGYLHLVVPEAKFLLTEGARDTSTYRFGSGSARHIFCRHCGVKSFYRPRSHPDAVSVNWRCLDADQPLPAAAVRPFDGQNWEAARAALG